MNSQYTPPGDFGSLKVTLAKVLSAICRTSNSVVCL